jgi:hypothetical protein
VKDSVGGGSTAGEQTVSTKEYNDIMAPPFLRQSSSVSELSNPTVVLQQDDNFRNDLSTDSSSDMRASHLALLWRDYGPRLFGAGMSWCLWDIAFYGNKLFSNRFFIALTGEDASLTALTNVALLNSSVALLGYFGAAVLVDRPELGRLKLQSIGFFLTGTLFVMCGFFYESLSSGLLVGLYLASSFLGQLGPNATTFLIPAEIFPTEQRTYCHGIAASSGKVGALIAAVLFHFVSHEVDLFLIR